MSIILQGFCWRGGHVDILFKFVKVCAADGISFVYIFFLITLNMRFQQRLKSLLAFDLPYSTGRNQSWRHFRKASLCLLLPEDQFSITSITIANLT